MTAGKCVQCRGTFCLCCSLFTTIQCSIQWASFFLLCFQSKYPGFGSPGEIYSEVLGEQFRQNVRSIIKYSIFIYSYPFPSCLFLFHLPAECKLNTVRAGVLLVERRGSYPLIDLQILKSRSLLGCLVVSRVFSICQWYLLHCCVIPAHSQQGEVASGTRRKVKRQLSFQRYCHASRLLRGLAPYAPPSLHLLDDGYLGQAVVRRATAQPTLAGAGRHVSGTSPPV